MKFKFSNLKLVTLTFLMCSSVEAFAGASFSCQQNLGPRLGLRFTFEKSKGFSFDGKEWWTPFFMGPRVTLENSLTYKFGDKADLKSVAVVSQDETIPLVKYFESEGLSNEKGVVSDFLEMSGLEVVQKKTTLEVDLQTLLVKSHEVVVMDLVKYTYREYQCIIETDVFK